ncbi:MAG: hypothetical protein KDA67_13235 [Rhodobacteraceae bacterium]|nr:hypothetical protein [Paracoccaceae bacterium]
MRNPVSSASSSVRIADKNVVIEGPHGFCIDRQASQIGGNTAFVLLGNCRIVSPDDDAPSPAVRALLTASVSTRDPNGARVADSLIEMDRFFRSEAGRAALSRSADPATVEVLDTFQQDETFYLRALDTSDGIIPGDADDYWRAYFDVDLQMVSVSVIGLESSPISADQGLRTVREFAGLIRRRNGVISAVTAEATPETATEYKNDPAPPRSQTGRTLRKVGLLRKLFN